MRIKPKRPKGSKPPKTPPTVTVHVTVKNTPPDAARVAAQREAMETILAALSRD
jgi:hypothetical protein